MNELLNGEYLGTYVYTYRSEDEFVDKCYKYV